MFALGTIRLPMAVSFFVKNVLKNFTAKIGLHVTKGFTKGIKQKISVKVFLPPPNGHGDCATDLTTRLRCSCIPEQYCLCAHKRSDQS